MAAAAGSSGKPRLIFHVDVNSAFLSWEAVRRVKRGEPDLRLIPSAIGGSPESRRSIILAKSIPAKRFGVVTGEPVASALQKCPGLVLAPSDFGLYTRQSRAFKDICRLYAPAVEEFSIDEVFCDFTGTGLLYPDPIALAYEIKDRIREELGFTVNIGIGRNKLCAKMAGDFEKPDKVHTLYPEEIPEKMWPLPVSELLSCGPATARKLNRCGIRTIGDLAAAETGAVERLLGQKAGQQLWAYARGLDDSPVLPEAQEAKGYSNETTPEEDVIGYPMAESILLALADSVATRVRAEGKRARCIGVTVRGNDFRRHSHQKRLEQPTDMTREVYAVARQLLRELWDGEMPLRLLGLSMTEPEEDGSRQLDLFTDEEKREKTRELDRAVDRLRQKYGYASLSLGDSGRISVGKKHRAQADLRPDSDPAGEGANSVL